MVPDATRTKRIVFCPDVKDSAQLARGKSARLTRVAEPFLSLIHQPLSALVVHPHESIAVVNFDVEKTKRGEAENATHFSA